MPRKQMTLDENPFPLLIVGAGRMGSAWIRTLAGERPAAGPVRVVGVADPDPARSGAALPLPGVEVEPDPLAAARRLQPAGAILCTPPHTHAELALALLELGIPLLCEKPLARTPAEAQRMTDRALDLEVPLFLAAKFRFVRDLERAAELVGSGLLGRPVTARIEFAGSFPVAGSWHADRRLSGGGVVADNGPHAVDLARMLLGPVESIRAAAAPRVQEIGPEDTAHLLLRHRRGTLTRVLLSWSLPPSSPWYLQVQGAQGTLQAGWRESRYKMHDAPDWVVYGTGYDKEEALSAMAGAFARTVRGGGEYPVDREAALASVRLTAAACAELEEAR
jgi:predicted dehydrogenase